MPRPGDPPQDRRGRDDEGRVGDGGQAVASPWLGHDLATGALNHRGLVERLQTALALARRMETHVALVALALRAHDRGGTEPDGESDLAAATVRELRAAVREHDLVARLARDEFVVVLQVCEEGRALVVAARLLADLERVAARGRADEWRAAAGVAVYPDDAEDVADLLRAASVALGRARAAGGGALAYGGQPS